MRQGSPSLVGPAEDPETIIQRRIIGPRMIVAAEKVGEDIRQPRPDKNTFMEARKTETLEKESNATVAIRDQAYNRDPEREMMQ